MSQPVKDVLVLIAFMVAIVLWFEAERRHAARRPGWHPSQVDQRSCVSVYRVQRPFDYERDS